MRSDLAYRSILARGVGPVPAADSWARLRPSLVLLLVGMILALSHLGALAAAHPVPPVLRYVLLIDTSRSMSGHKELLGGLIRTRVWNELDGEIRAGQLFSLWTFDQEISTNRYLPVTWNPRNREMVGNRLARAFQDQVFIGEANFDRAWPEVAKLLARSGALTVVMIRGDTKPVVGTPFDEKINAVYQRVASQGKHPLLATTLVARAGEVIGWSVESISGTEAPAAQLATLTQKPSTLALPDPAISPQRAENSGPAEEPQAKHDSDLVRPEIGSSSSAASDPKPLLPSSRELEPEGKRDAATSVSSPQKDPERQATVAAIPTPVPTSEVVPPTVQSEPPAKPLPSPAPPQPQAKPAEETASSVATPEQTHAPVAAAMPKTRAPAGSEALATVSPVPASGGHGFLVAGLSLLAVALGSLYYFGRMHRAPAQTSLISRSIEKK